MGWHQTNRQHHSEPHCRGWHQTNRQHHSEPSVQGLASNKQTTSFRAASVGTGIKQTDNIIQNSQCRGWHQTNKQHHSEPPVQGLASNKHTTSFSSRQCRGWHQANIIQSRHCKGWHQGNIIQSRQCRDWHQTISRHHSELPVQRLASNKQTLSFRAVRTVAGFKQTDNIIQ